MQFNETPENYSKIALIFLILFLLLSFVNYVIFFAVVLILLIMFYIYIVKRKKLKKSTLLYILLLYALFCWAIFTLINTPNQLENVKTTFLIFIPSIALVAYILEKEDNAKFYFLVNLALMLFGFIISIYGVMLWLFGSLLSINGSLYQVLSIGPIRIKQLVFGVEPFLRITSITSNPNSLALWLEISIASTFYLFYLRGKTRKFMFLFVLFIQLGALILTFSRSGYIITFLIIFLWVIVFQKNRVRKYLLLICSLFILIPSIVYYINSFERFNQRFQFDFNGRDEIWGYALTELFKNPLRGIGFADSTGFLSSIYGTNIGVHNGFLTLALEIGLIPITILLFIWLIIIFNLYRSYKFAGDSYNKLKIISLLIFLTLFLIQQMVEAKLFRFDAVHFLWLYFVATSVLFINTIKLEKTK